MASKNKNKNKKPQIHNTEAEVIKKKEIIEPTVEKPFPIETDVALVDETPDARFEKEIEEYMKAQEESNEIFWSFFPDAKKIDSLNELQEPVPTFSELERAEREGNAAEIRLRELKEKERQEALLRNKAPNFADLEAAQRKADELFLKLYLSENSVTLKEDVSHIMNDEELYSSDAMARLCQRYLEYSREQGVPEDVLSLMSDVQFSLIQMMQIKFGYEDGLSVDEISKYARPDLQRESMVVARYELLKLRELSKEQVSSQEQKKSDIDNKILNASSRARREADRKNMEMLNRSR